MEIEKFLTERLKAGFASDESPEEGYKSCFPIKRVRYFETDSEGRVNRYHDEWTKGRLGGGQEVAHIEDEKGESDFTRLYAGGTLTKEELIELGTSKEAVGEYLSKMLRENGEKTRLFADFEPEPEGDWEYSYKLTDYEPQFELYTAKETIRFRKKLVFVHQLLLSPVK